MKSKPLWIATILFIILAIIFYYFEKRMMFNLSFSVGMVAMLFAVIYEIYEENNML